MKKMHFMGKLGLENGLEKVSARPRPLKKHFLTFTLSVNKIIYQFLMFKSLDSIASVVGIFMYPTISKFKQVLRSRKGLDYNTGGNWYFHLLKWGKITTWQEVQATSAEYERSTEMHGAF